MKNLNDFAPLLYDRLIQTGWRPEHPSGIWRHHTGRKMVIARDLRAIALDLLSEQRDQEAWTKVRHQAQRYIYMINNWLGYEANLRSR